MGLDMYLYAYNYICYSKTRDMRELDMKISELFPELGGSYPIRSVKIEVGYWRKAYVIHNWFVKNIQHGKDDCREYVFEEPQIKELISTIDKVLTDRSKAPELLPDIEMIKIAFGGKPYDDFYFEELEYTKKLLEDKVIELLKNGWEFVYQSSW